LGYHTQADAMEALISYVTHANAPPDTGRAPETRPARHPRRLDPGPRGGTLPDLLSHRVQMVPPISGAGQTHRFLVTPTSLTIPDRPAHGATHHRVALHPSVGAHRIDYHLRLCQWPILVGWFSMATNTSARVHGLQGVANRVAMWREREATPAKAALN